MKITILTLFPTMFDGFLSTSIIARSIERGLVQIEIVDIRNFALDTYKHVDDSPFGGGSGMVLKCQPVFDAINAIKNENSFFISTSPAGEVFNQQMAHALSKKEHLVILCGHYEGIDHRIEQQMDELISIGDYVLTGGELASQVICDAIIRLLKGSIKEDSILEESFENGLLEYPQYTQPSDYQGQKVPAVLLSGNHAKIKEYRYAMSLIRTMQNRPDLFAKYPLTEKDRQLIKTYLDEMESTD